MNECDHYTASECGPDYEDIPGHKTRRNCWSVALVLLVAISLVFSVSTMVLYGNRQSADSRSVGTSTKVPICIPCSNIEPVAEEDEELSRIYKSLDKKMDRKTGIQQCCARNSQETEFLKLILKKISVKTSRHPSHPRADALSSIKVSHGSSSIAYAQKALCVNKWAKDKFKNQTCSLEITFRSRLELVRGVKIIKSGILILHPGLYFVYKNINFFPDSSDPCKNFKDQTFRSYLIRQRSEFPTVLLTSEHTCCPDCVHDSQTGFSGGVFQLNKGDLIQVNVTGSEFVHVGRDVTYVGLMMMGGENLAAAS